MPNALVRFARFASVGLATLGVKMSALAALRELAGLDPLAAIALATEIAIVHSFLWHQNWTWRDRRGGRTLSRLVRYNVLNGTLAIGVNVLVMRALVNGIGLHYLLGGLTATIAAGVVNYLLSDKLVFVLLESER